MKAGSVPRIPTPEIEAIVDNAVRERLKDQGASKEALFGQIERVVLREDGIDVTLNSQDKKELAPAESIVIPWARTEPCNRLGATSSRATRPKAVARHYPSPCMAERHHDGPTFLRRGSCACCQAASEGRSPGTTACVPIARRNGSDPGRPPRSHAGKHSKIAAAAVARVATPAGLNFGSPCHHICS